MNTCKHCGFVGNPEEFRNPAGIVCEKCHEKYQKEYRENNKEKITETGRKYRENNKEKIAEIKKKYSENNKEKLAEQRRKQYQANREENLERRRIYRENNKEKIAEQNRRYRESNKEKIAEHDREYYKNNSEKILEQHKKYRKENSGKINEQARFKRRKVGILPWTEIKHLRLGLYIEQTIAAMFGVPTEPHNNPDVDFVCPQGYKMQVKVSSVSHSKNKNPTWRFHINKNKIADYFILVAVNNAEDIDKEDFKPIHIWMMKGKLINKKGTISTVLSRVPKWNKYSIMEEYENRFVACCTTIKESKFKDTSK